jgi:protein-S-isoprenylcysteine O-methyltransferase Ste14
MIYINLNSRKDSVMAKDLNKSRINNTRIVFLLALLIIFLTRSMVSSKSELHEITEYIGYFLVAICALGRVYSTAFLGGYKNTKLITYGVFSVVRNPLYVFSLIGMFGVSLVSGYITIIIICPIVFLVMYHYLISREEVFLLEHFGAEYQQYLNTVPRLIPNFKLYNAPQTISVNPKFLAKSFKDAIWWFAAFPFIELAEFLHRLEYLPTLFIMP